MFNFDSNTCLQPECPDEPLTNSLFCQKHTVGTDRPILRPEQILARRMTPNDLYPQRITPEINPQSVAGLTSGETAYIRPRDILFADTYHWIINEAEVRQTPDEVFKVKISKIDCYIEIDSADFDSSEILLNWPGKNYTYSYALVR